MRNIANVVAASVFALIIVGCAGTDAEEPKYKSATAQIDGEECETADGYDECRKKDIGEMKSWEETLPEPTWRTVEQKENGNLSVKIDVNELNNGFVRLSENQGVYESEEDFKETRRQLLGITEGEQAEFNVSVDQIRRNPEDCRG